MEHLPSISGKDPDKSFILNYAPLFAGLSAPDKELIIQKSKVVEYRKGDIIYKQLDPPGAFYCVITGRVRIFTRPSGREGKIFSDAREKEVLEYLNCGKYFGIISLLTGEPHSISAEAANDSKILVITKDDFQAILDRVPRLAIDLSQTLSRRIRKKELGEKKIFESNIISVFNAAPGIAHATYAVNFAFSLKRETGRDTILVHINRNEEEIHSFLKESLKEAEFSRRQIINLHTPLLEHHIIEEGIHKSAESGISILGARYDKADKLCAASLNTLLTYLTGNYHYIIVILPASSFASFSDETQGMPREKDIQSSIDEVVFQALGQSDMIHIFTDYDIANLKNARTMIADLFKKINYPQDKIKLITSERDKSKCLPYDTVYKLLNYRIYASLAVYKEKDEMSEASLANIVLERPEAEYSRVMRRMAREIGDMRVGLALGGGAAFGLSHIGVIKVLEKENIPIDMVVGSSMGAFIGALWATGLSGGEIEKVFMEYDNEPKKTFHLLGDMCFPRMSVAKGERIKNFLRKYIGGKTFHDVKLPFRVVACNLSRREVVIYNSGRILDAVMASIAIPGVFAPTRIGGDLIIDGGVLEPVPVGTLVRMGIKKIIAVNVLPNPEHIAQGYEFKERQKESEMKALELKGLSAKILYQFKDGFRRIFSPNIMDIIVNSIQTLEYVIADSDCQKADIVINPIGVGVEWFEFFKAGSLIKKGEEEAEKSLEAIKSVINE